MWPPTDNGTGKSAPWGNLMHRFRRLIPPVTAFLLTLPAVGDQLPPDASYHPLPTQPLATVRAEDEAAKPEVMRQQQQLFEQRFDLSDRPIPGVMMSGGGKPVQGGVRVKLPQGVSWDSLAQMTPDEIRNRGPRKAARPPTRTASIGPQGEEGPQVGRGWSELPVDRPPCWAQQEHGRSNPATRACCEPMKASVTVPKIVTS
jgi:hypothetical protein